MASNNVKAAAAIACMLLFGSLNTILLKMLLTVDAVGVDGEQKQFKKPWFMTFTMFLSMVMSLGFVAAQNCQSSRANKLNESLVDKSNIQETGAAKDGQLSYLQKVRLVAIPAMFDLCGIGIALIGLLLIPASIWQILRGAEIVFAEIISVFLLKEKSLTHKWLGIGFCILGIAIVGAASVAGGSAHGDKAEPQSLLIFGIAIVLFSQIVQAGQMVGEEYFMKELDLEAMEVIGYEGMWGLLAMVCVVMPTLYVMPGADSGCQENTYDSLVMLANSSHLLGLWFLLFCSCLIYNLSGIMITQYLTAVHRVICEAMRTLVVWMAAIYVYYFVDSSSGFGEALTPYSVYVACGFGVVFLGQVTYGALIAIPGIKYPPPTPHSSPKPISSPSAMRSPLYRLEQSPQKQ